ncbi:hypothetical protein ASZ78_000656 [Callipepla squamata]|uniref:Uncharacterized protein n=1 Tax=Callipepla squamata TaxID=9009 RepID=A0A226NFD5_CALSU|nr:hypothetical protein ASZ78_000656 [Callipepla squamata]
MVFAHLYVLNVLGLLLFVHLSAGDAGGGPPASSAPPPPPPPPARALPRLEGIKARPRGRPRGLGAGRAPAHRRSPRRWATRSGWSWGPAGPAPRAPSASNRCSSMSMILRVSSSLCSPEDFKSLMLHKAVHRKSWICRTLPEEYVKSASLSSVSGKGF